MTSAPVVHDLKPLDAEPLGDLCRSNEFINIDTATHTRIVTHVAYKLTHPQLHR